jgi:hypothetical protein
MPRRTLTATGDLHILTWFTMGGTFREEFTYESLFLRTIMRAMTLEVLELFRS